ncbi:MAG: TorD/DmsD family molecular chaperone [Planctomycetota bacterium]|jgi:TorA maturation chaperone TorD
MEDALNEACQRADSYKLLSECYHLPDNALVQKIVDVAKTDHFFTELKACIPSDLELESLKVDYTRLFVGPFKLLAPPYGSVYLEDNRIMAESTIDVGKWYEKEVLNVLIKGPPDHIAMELEFMYYLAVRQIQATKEGNSQDIQLYQNKQKLFLCSHLARWLSKFTENVQKNAQTEFYRKLAGLTETFVHKDAETLAHYGVFDSRFQLESN